MELPLNLLFAPSLNKIYFLSNLNSVVMACVSRANRLEEGTVNFKIFIGVQF